MALADDFNRLEQSLADDWSELRLAITIPNEGQCDRAAALLGPANPGRRGKRFRVNVARRGRGLGPDAMRRLLRRLDQAGIRGRLEPVAIYEADPAALRTRSSLREEWDLALAGLPPDWSDLYAEVRLVSTDYVEPTALLLAPLNPSHVGGPTTLRFRSARRYGYGAAPEMVERCLERCDERGITGAVEILWAVSDTYPVGTQGPVWYTGGRVV